MADFFVFLFSTNLANAAFIIGAICVAVAIIGKLNASIDPPPKARFLLALFGSVMIFLSLASFLTGSNANWSHIGSQKTITLPSQSTPTVQAISTTDRTSVVQDIGVRTATVVEPVDITEGETQAFYDGAVFVSVNSAFSGTPPKANISVGAPNFVTQKFTELGIGDSVIFEGTQKYDIRIAQIRCCAFFLGNGSIVQVFVSKIDTEK